MNTFFFYYGIFRFPYLDCPEERFILTALKQLYQYDAIDRWSDILPQPITCYTSTLQETIETLEYVFSIFPEAHPIPSTADIHIHMTCQ